MPIAITLHEHVPAGVGDIHWLYLVLFAGSSLASSWLVIHGVKMIEAGAAGIIGLLEIVWAILFGIVFFHERPALIAYIGAACIVIAAVMPYIKEMKTATDMEERIA